MPCPLTCAWLPLCQTRSREWEFIVLDPTMARIANAMICHAVGLAGTREVGIAEVLV